jgi:hypothetical protein
MAQSHRPAPFVLNASEGAMLYSEWMYHIYLCVRLAQKTFTSPNQSVDRDYLVTLE